MMGISTDNCKNLEFDPVQQEHVTNFTVFYDSKNVVKVSITSSLDQNLTVGKIQVNSKKTSRFFDNNT